MSGFCFYCHLNFKSEGKHWDGCISFTLHDYYVCGSMLYFLVSFIMLLTGLLISVNGLIMCSYIKSAKVIISRSASDSYMLKWNVDHDFSTGKPCPTGIGASEGFFAITN